MRWISIYFIIIIACQKNETPLNPVMSVNIDLIVTSYLQIQKDLAFDDNTNIYANILNVKKAIQAASEENIINWQIVSSDLRSSVELYSSTSSIVKNRESFQLLTRAVIKLIQEYGYTEDIFILKCPMAFNNKGATWLQTDKNLINPYFGAEMFKCGNVVKQLNNASNN